MEARIVINKENDTDLTIKEFLSKNDKFDKVIFYEVLDTILPDDLMKFLFEVKTKLNPKAIISIQGYDLYELAFSIVHDRISTIEFNRIIENKKQLLCIPDINSILNHLGFKIISKDIDAMRFLVEAESV